MKRLRIAAVAGAALVLIAAASSQAQDAERVAEILIHGNHTTPEADVRALSGLTVGDLPTETRLRDAETKLKDSGRFADVQLLRRFRSIDNPSEILIVIIVDERPGVSEDNLIPGPAERFRSAAMWMPILSHADGYGFTYGARVSFVNVLGKRSRLSVPLTWGGERRAAMELERTSDGPISVFRASLSADRRVNPLFELPDSRAGARIDAEHIFTGWLRAGADARSERVRFGSAYDARHTAGGVHAIVDTRVDPSFPRNAVDARLGWEHIDFEVGGAGRWIADARGYLGVGGSVVLAVRGQLTRADAALPLAEQSLLGGSDSLRGYPAGYDAGDSLAGVSAELRYPLTSPLRVGRLGLKAFVDAAAAWNAGERLRDQRFSRGIGGGVYIGAAAVIMDLDVAWPEEGRPRAHFGLGVTF
jgi:hypothetical protein